MHNYILFQKGCLVLSLRIFLSQSMLFYSVFVLINQSMNPESLLSYSVLVLICQSTSQPFSAICSLLVLINQSINAILQCIRTDQSNNQLFDAVFYNVLLLTDQSIEQSKMPMIFFFLSINQRCRPIN